MNYEKIYYKLIKKAKNRSLESNIKYEKHHVIPRCLGGSNKKENIVYLTYREHFLAHLLLLKIYDNHPKLLKACMMMGVGRQNSRKYSWLKEKFSNLRREEIKIFNPTKNKKWISNEKETLLVEKKEAENLVKQGLYVYGKSKNVFFCDKCKKLLKSNCKSCRIEKIKNKYKDFSKKRVEKLWQKFLNSDHISITSFSKTINISQPRLSKLFDTHIEDYRKYKKQGKSFKKKYELR
ncbi:MAG: HNH endonuclease [Candidatus Dojkabacteria bacterium]|nr:HNH endonuclease [Candidatus Dojkabacteria bacterium]